MRVDLHTHTSASFDCRVPPRELMARCRHLGLGPVAITDHGTLEGALGLSRTAPGLVIVGQEIITLEGEIIGLFLHREVPANLSIEQAVEEIRSQGGLVYLEHPYDGSRRSLQEEAIERLADQIDIVEVFNGRSDDAANDQAVDLCATIGAAPGAGSDAHTLEEIGTVYIEMNAWDTPSEFLAGLRDGTVVRRPSLLRLRAEAFVRARIRRG